MRNVLLPAVAATFLLAAPALALAQTSGSNSTTNNPPPSPAQVEQKIHQDLSKAGYTDINVMPGSYLVTAKDSKGMPTEMMIRPNSVTEVTAMNQPNNSGQSNSGKTTKD